MQYTPLEDLYRKKEKIRETFSTTTFNQYPAITEAEVAKAIKEISNQNSPGIDNLSAELIKTTGEEGKKHERGLSIGKAPYTFHYPKQET